MQFNESALMNIQADEVLNQKQIQEIDIVIKTISNNVYNFTVATDTTIATLKDLIHSATQIESERQRLIYRGRVLVNESTVRDYNIESGHTIHMVAKPLNITETVSTSEPASENNNLFQNQTIPRTSNALPVLSTINGAADLTVSTVPNSFEHVRQGLLSIHTLVSTMDPSDFSYRSSRQQDTSNTIEYDYLETQMEAEVGEKTNFPSIQSRESLIEENGKMVVDYPSSFKDDDKTRPTKRGRGEGDVINRDKINSESNSKSASERITERGKRFFRGQWIDVKDTVSQWLEATIMDIDYDDCRVYVHYNGWPERWDEWIAFDSPRISPFRSRTAHSSLSTFLSPVPNIQVASAPCTGSNDVRVYLPEFSKIINMLQPAMEEIAELAEEA